MRTWTFTAYGRTKEIEAESALSAMSRANLLFGSLPQGAWMERGSTGFYWAEGNFFD